MNCPKGHELKVPLIFGVRRDLLWCSECKKHFSRFDFLNKKLEEDQVLEMLGYNDRCYVTRVNSNA
jgi:hypothetical protein